MVFRYPIFSAAMPHGISSATLSSREIPSITVICRTVTPAACRYSTATGA